MTMILSNEQDKVAVPNHWEVQMDKAITVCLQQQQIDPKAEVSVLFVDDEAIQEINRIHRNKDMATDVLSFPMYEADEEIEDEEEILFGDIVISLERAMDQSEQYGHSLEREVMYLLVHGLLHLAGYDHMEEEEKQQMRQQEEQLLEMLGITR